MEADTAPIDNADRIATVTALIRGDDDEDQGSKGQDQEPGSSTQDDTDRGDDTGTRQDDISAHDGVSGVPDDEADATEASDTGGDSDESPTTLESLANHLEVEQSDVYELEVPIGDGVSVSIGQLKDEYKQYGPIREAEEHIKERDDKHEKALLKTRIELNAILQTIPPEIREAAARNGQQYQMQYEKDQARLVSETIPEWADADKRAKDREMLIEDGAEYGFSESEITYTQDARTLRWMRDFSRMKRELGEMRAGSKRVTGKPSPPGKANKTNTGKRRLAAALKRAKADPTIQGKASAVSELIRNQ